VLTAATARVTAAAVNEKSCKLAAYKILKAIIIYCRSHLIATCQVLTVRLTDILKSSVLHSVVWSSLPGQQYIVNLKIYCWTAILIQWKPLIMITFGPALFDNNNWLITLSGGYKNLHYLTQFIVMTFCMYKKQQNLFKKLM
jgi:hypothetical protein